MHLKVAMPTALISKSTFLMDTIPPKTAVRNAAGSPLVWPWNSGEGSIPSFQNKTNSWSSKGDVVLVRLELKSSGAVIARNSYWQSEFSANRRYLYLCLLSFVTCYSGDLKYNFSIDKY